VFILIVGGALWAITVLTGRLPADEAFLAVVGLAVATIPEGLPAVITIILAIAARTMARNQAIVRRLPAVETLGSVSTICSDKTGTLTRNEMTVVALYLEDAAIRVTGTGYDPEGGFLDDAGSHLLLADHPQALELVTAAALCNDASLRFTDEWIISGDPTEAALATLAHKADLDISALRTACPRIDEIPFASETRFMATLHHDHAGHAWVVVKGAPERIAQMTEAPSGAWHDRALRAATNGQRVLAVATADVPAGTATLSADALPRDLRIIGLVGIQDPARGEAVAAIEDCHRAGIAVKMITGDHLSTAEAIGASLRLQVGSGGVQGHDIDTMTDAQARAALQNTDIIARASPDNKLRLVRLLQQDGQFVAMTGDGANDAPALKAADIGVAMGGRGTDAAREASDLVLVDDNFRTIRDAVQEGRVVYDNIKKSLAFILPTNGGEGLLILVALLAGWTLPVTVTQILWVNMVTAVTLALALAFEGPEPDVMKMPPRPASQPLLTRPLLTQVAGMSVVLVVITVAAFEWELARGSSVEMARTTAVTTLVVAEAFYLFAIRHFTRSAFTWDTWFGSRAAVIVTGILAVLQGLFIYAPFMQSVFATRPLGPQSWALVLALCAAMFLTVEIFKWLWRRVGVRRL
jgi:magnesium-transporting ATPase (P-type)